MDKLKKLSLQKEEIVNLNDFEMNAARGGTSSMACFRATVEIISAVWSVFSAATTLMGNAEESPFNSGHMVQCNDTVKVCELPEVEVEGYGGGGCDEEPYGGDAEPDWV